MNEKIIEQITKTAVQATMEYLEKDRKLQQVSKRDRRLRNTKLLLKNYRSFVSHAQELEHKLSALEEAKTLSELQGEGYTVEAIKKSQARTIVMVRFIQRSLDAYRSMCLTSGQSEDARRYQVIEAIYFSEPKPSVEKIAEFHKIDPRTVYNDINIACKTLSVLIFGVDAVELE